MTYDEIVQAWNVQNIIEKHWYDLSVVEQVEWAYQCGVEYGTEELRFFKEVTK